MSTLVPMPTIFFSPSVRASFSSTAAPPSSGAYRRVVPSTVTRPFRWYIPFIPAASRTFRRGLRVSRAGYPREEKFFSLLSSASLQAYPSFSPPNTRSSCRWLLI